jgi:hypothetical protein
LAICIVIGISVKRKSQSDDDFLSVLTISGKVVDVCDIPTTIVMVAVGGWRPGGVSTAALEARSRSALANQRGPYESETGHHMQKGRGDLAAALSVVRLREA